MRSLPRDFGADQIRSLSSFIRQLSYYNFKCVLFFHRDGADSRPDDCRTADALANVGPPPRATSSSRESLATSFSLIHPAVIPRASSSKAIPPVSLASCARLVIVPTSLDREGTPPPPSIKSRTTRTSSPIIPSRRVPYPPGPTSTPPRIVSRTWRTTTQETGDNFRISPPRVSLLLARSSPTSRPSATLRTGSTNREGGGGIRRRRCRRDGTKGVAWSLVGRRTTALPRRCRRRASSLTPRDSETAIPLRTLLLLSTPISLRILFTRRVRWSSNPTHRIYRTPTRIGGWAEQMGQAAGVPRRVRTIRGATLPTRPPALAICACNGAHSPLRARRSSRYISNINPSTVSNSLRSILPPRDNSRARTS